MKSFQRRYIGETSHSLLAAMFFMDQICFSYFCGRSPTDCFCHNSILTIGFRGEDAAYINRRNWPCPLVSLFFDKSN